MRIIAGRLGGLQFLSPKTSTTHPMSEKIRGAIFNTLGDIEGLQILDAFAGSGALAFEALSRGAAYAVAVDSDKAAVQAIMASSQSLRVASQINITQSSTRTWLAKNASQRFDIIFADPPYNDPQYEIIERLAKVLAPSGILIVSLPTSLEDARIPGLKIIKQKTYGDARISAFAKAD